jgi:hypothetical protein
MEMKNRKKETPSEGDPEEENPPNDPGHNHPTRSREPGNNHQIRPIARGPFTSTPSSGSYYSVVNLAPVLPLV